MKKSLSILCVGRQASVCFKVILLLITANTPKCFLLVMMQKWQ